MTDDAFIDALVRAGLGGEAAERKAALLVQAQSALSTCIPGCSADDTEAVFVPGRIEVLGKHTDYAGGRSLLCTADRGVVAVSAPRADGRLQVLDAAGGSAAELDLVPDAVATGPAWATYAEAVGRRVARNFPGSSGGASVAFASDLPRAAGLSSSSALVVAVFLALARVSQIALAARYTDVVRRPEDLAGYLAAVENGLSFGTLIGDRGVGTFGGSEDHTAMLCCRAGWLSQYAFCPVRRELDVPLPRDLVFVVASSGVAAEKTGAARHAYNRAALMAGQVLERWNRASGRRDESLAAACASSPDAVERIRAAVRQAGDAGGFTPEALMDRFTQFHEESLSIVPAASAALLAGDVAGFGALASRSHELAERCLDNQVPETIHLAGSAAPLGALAASAFGAGFGGSVWALVARERAPRFLDAWREDYTSRFPSRAAGSLFFETRPGPAAVHT